VLRLVWKDVVAARWLLLAGLPIYAFNLAAMIGVRPVYVMISFLVSMMLAFGSLGIEEMQGTGTLWASLPVRRAEIVFARYLTVMLGALTGLGISLGVDRAMTAVSAVAGRGAGASLGASAGAHVVLLLLILLVAAVLLPLCFRLGAGNGVLAFGVVSVVAILVLSLGGQLALWLAGLSNPLLDPALYRGAPEAEQTRAALDWLRRRGGIILGLSGLLTAVALVFSAALSRNVFEMRDLSS